ncbi:MAG: metallophosphoesterase [Candidatus Polarisedimenticolaceae bacterium]|nr:metallophosphoesterase [Candidatus Polarisedimenticolaceae bacterium]
MRILVIDDQEWRRIYYENLANIAGFEYELTFFSEEETNAIESKSVEEYDLVLLDVVLDNDEKNKWELTSSQVAKRIRDISSEVPIVLITGNWTSTNHPEIQQLSECFDTHPVPLPFTDLLTKKQFDDLTGDRVDKRDCKGIKDTNIGYLARTLQVIVASRSRQVYLGKDKNESLYILHLSDMQIGGENEKGNKLEPSTIAQYVQGLYGNPDFIAVTGDVTENGHPDEFREASLWFSGMCEEIGWQKPYEKLLLVPGNHDVFAPAFGVCTTEYVRSDPDSGVKGGWKANNDVKNLHIASSYSFSNFREFAYELTRNKYWVGNKKCDWIENRYTSNGLCFLGLNSVIGHDYESPFSGLPSDDYYQEYRRKIRNLKRSADVLSIALAHHPSLATDQSYKTFSQTKPRPDILLTGHLHKPDQDDLRELGQLMFVAPTSSLKAELRWPDVNRGFSIIELKRDNRKITGIEYHSHIRVSDRWMPVKGLSREYEYADGKWKEVYKD